MRKREMLKEAIALFLLSVPDEERREEGRNLITEMRRSRFKVIEGCNRLDTARTMVVGMRRSYFKLIEGGKKV